jgi:hypothetical protein
VSHALPLLPARDHDSEVKFRIALRKQKSSINSRASGKTPPAPLPPTGQHLPSPQGHHGGGSSSEDEEPTREKKKERVFMENKILLTKDGITALQYTALHIA